MPEQDVLVSLAIKISPRGLRWLLGRKEIDEEKENPRWLIESSDREAFEVGHGAESNP